jgi:hypothetical protein
VEEAPPGRETSEPIGQPIEPRETPQPVELLVNVEKPEPYMTSVTPELERNNELPEIDRAPAAFGPVVFVEPLTNTDKPDPIQAPVEPKVPDERPVAADKPDPIPAWVETRRHEQNVGKPTISISPPSERATAGRVKLAVSLSIEEPSQQPGPSLGHWSSTLFEIKQKIEPLASDTLQRLPRLDQVCISRLALVTHAYPSQPRYRENQSILSPSAVLLCAYSCTAPHFPLLNLRLPTASSDPPPLCLTTPPVISRAIETSRLPRLGLSRRFDCPSHW